MTTKANKGFTLIELLVVIAIIGILSSVVLASLNTARDKGEDAAIKSNLNNARAQAELYYDGASPNSYVNVCTNNSTGIGNTITAVTEFDGNARCDDLATGWAAQAQLSDGSSYYCVDSTGQATTTSGYTIGDGDNSDVVC